MEDSYLYYAIVYLVAAVILVPLFKKLGLGAVLGYLTAGILIGPYGFELIEHNILHFAEFGVVLLLFLIGLELEPSRLWKLRQSVFGHGLSQVAVTSVLLYVIGLMFGLSHLAAAIVAFALSLSSTAFVLQILAERNEMNTLYGRSAFSVLLFQDLAVIPAMAIIPLFADTGQGGSTQDMLIAVAKVVGVIAGVIVAGRFLLRHVLRAIAVSRIHEIFTALSLLLVLGIAYLMHTVGLSMALGSFLAGVLLADSEYRHELEVNIEPFKGLLLGLFFIAVGMSVNFELLLSKPLILAGLVVILMAVKFAVLFGLGRSIGLPSQSTTNLAFLLPQGGEFAFVIFTVALKYKLVESGVTDLLILAVTVSMALTPLGILLNDKVIKKRTLRDEQDLYDEIEDEDNPVIVAGFGRFGQIVSRVLMSQKIGVTALEHSAEQVEVVRRFGQKIYYGDASRIDLLRAAGAEKAKLFILAIDDVESSLQTAEVVRQHFPDLRVMARARNRSHVFRLIELGVETFYRETYSSSLEMANDTLLGLGFSDGQAKRAVSEFRQHDEALLVEQQKVHHDEAQLISLTTEASQQLSEVFAADKEEVA